MSAGLIHSAAMATFRAIRVHSHLFVIDADTDLEDEQLFFWVSKASHSVTQELNSERWNLTNLEDLICMKLW